MEKARDHLVQRQPKRWAFIKYFSDINVHSCVILCLLKAHIRTFMLTECGSKVYSVLYSTVCYVSQYDDRGQGGTEEHKWLGFIEEHHGPWEQCLA